MKPNSSVPRRTVLAIAAASAGLTLAVTATIASSFGLIAPAAPPPATDTGVAQPTQAPLAPGVTDGLASQLPGAVDQSTTSAATARSSGPGDVGVALREHHNEGDDRRRETLRRAPLTGASAERTARPAVSRDDEDDDDD
jgi:hypothetical protein